MPTKPKRLSDERLADLVKIVPCYGGSYETWHKETVSALLELQARRKSDAGLYEALKLAITKMAHRFECLKVNPTEEWAKNGSWSVDGCVCEIKQVNAALRSAESEGFTQGINHRREQNA